MKRVLFFLALLLAPWIASAHVGSPNVFFDGKAGTYPVRVIVRPPGVVPGLAEISIRVEGSNVRRVTALPVFWNAGRKGAPPPDEARLVRGETNLYATELWLMKPGAYSVDVTVEGANGTGSVVVPVNSLALTRNTMEPWFATILLGAGVGLFVVAVRIAGAAFGEATVEPGVALTRTDHRRMYVAMGIAAVFFVAHLVGGKIWWDREDADYRNNRLYKPQPVSAAVRGEGDQNILRIEVDKSRYHRPEWTPLIPDHGKMMHLFLIREPGLDAFAHIHPVQRDKWTFEVALPPLPSGSYRLYADVTHENGLSQTLVATAQLPERRAAEPAANPFLTIDPDDSRHSDPAASSSQETTTSVLVDGCKMVWDKGDALKANREASLRFKVVDAAGRPMPLQPYMGMLGHAAVRRDDGAVFAHLHPVGSISMASQDFFTAKSDPGKDAPVDHSAHMAAATSETGISFPYEFPKPGRYRIWVQVKIGDRVLTGVFDTEVLAARK